LKEINPEGKFFFVCFLSIKFLVYYVITETENALLLLINTYLISWKGILAIGKQLQAIKTTSETNLLTHSILSEYF
jgi:hypothetical protein